jgi:hypothetical protein
LSSSRGCSPLRWAGVRHRCVPTPRWGGSPRCWVAKPLRWPDVRRHWRVHLAVGWFSSRGCQPFRWAGVHRRGVPMLWWGGCRRDGTKRRARRPCSTRSWVPSASASFDTLALGSLGLRVIRYVGVGSLRLHHWVLAAIAFCSRWARCAGSCHCRGLLRGSWVCHVILWSAWSSSGRFRRFRQRMGG